MAKKLSYWERRAAQDMFRYMQSAESTSQQIARLYLKASRYLSVEADEIFEKYQTKHSLSEDDAMRLINSMQDKTSITELLEKLRSDDKDKNKLELLKKLEAPAYQARLERLQQLQNQLDYVMKNVYQQEKDFSTSHYVDLANESYYRGIFNIQQQIGMGFSFGYVDAKMIDQVVNSKWLGKNYSQRIWKNTRQLAQDLKEELLINLVTGRTNREVAEIIANKYAVGAYKARRLVRTESNYLSNELNFRAYEECGIEKYRFLAVFDLRTSNICRLMDGKIFLLSEKIPEVNYPPLHPFCRSTTISIIDERLLDKLNHRTYHPITGKQIDVPMSMSYLEWYEKFVKGRPEVECEEKKIKNRSSDRTQWRKYKEILGKDAPDTLDKFQDMKYNKWEDLKLLYKNQKLRNRLGSDETSKTIHEGKQGKHILGHNNYISGRSYLTISQEEAQRLINKYAGTGTIQRDSNGRWSNKEHIICNKEIGMYVNPEAGSAIATNRFTIHYSKDGVHIVPARRETK